MKLLGECHYPELYAGKKEIERLRWMCLIRNQDFQEWWTWCQQKRKDHSLPLPRTEAFKKKLFKGRQYPPPLFFISKYFFVHLYEVLCNEETLSDDTFEKYWTNLQNRIESDEYMANKAAGFPKAIKNCREDILENIDAAVYHCMRDQKREPTISELKDFIGPRFSPSALVIRQKDFTFEEADYLSRQVKKILEKNVIHRERFRREYSRYLLVYDMRTAGRSNAEIAKAIYQAEDLEEIEGRRTGDAKTDKEIADEINKFFRYAERLIQNAATNDFPGNYRNK